MDQRGTHRLRSARTERSLAVREQAKIPIISGQQADEILDLSSTDTDSSSTSSVSSGVSGTTAAPKPKPPKGPKFKFSPALAKLLVYTIGVKYRGFNKKEVYPSSNMISLSERTANKVIKQGLGDVIKHNRSHLMRLYPNVTRLTSSNYEPTRYWASGAQLVSINWQSTGTSSQGPRQSAQRISDRPLAPQTRASGSTAPCLRVTAAAATFSNRPTSASRIRRRRTRQRAARCMSRC
jgi:hypothetical protein